MNCQANVLWIQGKLPSWELCDWLTHRPHFSLDVRNHLSSYLNQQLSPQELLIEITTQTISHTQEKIYRL